MNNYQNEIQRIFNSANSSIKVAVSWFTDELLLENLIERAKHVSVEVLLSSDEVNVLRHRHFRKLIGLGARVQKLGTNNALQGEFMHSKFIIIDEGEAYGGSYNFTSNAKSNFENFKLYAQDEVQSLNRNFNDWMCRSIDFFADLISPEKIVEELKRKFAYDEKRHQRLFEEIQNGFKNEEDSMVHYKLEMVKSEVRKEELRTIASSLSTGTIGINENGVVGSNSKNTGYVKPHKFYGGSFLSVFNGKKRPNSYAISFLQKKNIENKYNFIKCRIVNDSLICKGIFKTNQSETYTFRVEYRAGEFPQVYILSPDLDTSPDIHVYKEGCLCLFYPPDIKWKDTTNIAEYTIPWLIEWIYLYELWKLTGKWEASEEKHQRKYEKV